MKVICTTDVCPARVQQGDDNPYVLTVQFPDSDRDPETLFFPSPASMYQAKKRLEKRTDPYLIDLIINYIKPPACPDLYERIKPLRKLTDQEYKASEALLKHKLYFVKVTDTPSTKGGYEVYDCLIRAATIKNRRLETDTLREVWEFIDSLQNETEIQ